MTRVAIIGSGPTGIYSLQGLIRSQRPIAITIYEETPDPGRGTPYHPAVNDAVMLANIASIEIPRMVDSLHEWLCSQSDEQLMSLDLDRSQLGEREFYPRIVLGAYFEAQFVKLVALGEAMGHAIRIRGSHRVTDIRLGRDDITVLAKALDGAKIAESFDHVVMATGHDWPEDTETSRGYFISPWPAAAIKRIGPVDVGILGTSLSGIDAAVTVATAHGTFVEGADQRLTFRLDEESRDLTITMMSRKGLLPEADFYCPIPYEPCLICTPEAMEDLIALGPDGLLDRVFDLFRQEVEKADRAYAAEIGLHAATVEDIAERYFRKRAAADPFDWAAGNLAQAKCNRKDRVTVQWRYAILRCHENVAMAVPHLNTDDLKRFHTYFKSLFVDDYATVPHASIERLLALHAANVLEVRALGKDYAIRKQDAGATLVTENGECHYEAFIDATGRNAASACDLPFPSLRQPGLVQEAATVVETDRNVDAARIKRTGGIDLDETFRPIMRRDLCRNLYCVSIPFLLHKLPFVQGITSARDMGAVVSREILAEIDRVARSEIATNYDSENTSPTEIAPSPMTPA